MSNPEVLHAVASMPRMLTRLVVSFLRFKRASVRAEKQFYQTLVKNGMPKREARELAAVYSAPTSLRSWVKMGK
jgi:hypothetical protein